jgi:release factor glutamine methyltransferase
VESVLAEQSGQHVEILDMCTGSGCIAISLAILMGAEVVAVDLSEEALKTAKDNARRLQAQVTWIQSDLFTQLTPHQYDILVSNPPYIPTGEIEKLMPEVSCFEPKMALDGRDDGLYFYRKLAQEAGRFLKQDGKIYWEIGCEQAQAVTDLLIENGFKQVQVMKDYAGLDRVIKASR